MASSISYRMMHTQGHHGELDRVGGIPTHLPPSWPCCEECGEEMFFVGQIYAKEGWFPLDDKLCIHLYSCCCDDEPVHLEVLGKDAPSNNEEIGHPHPDQELMDIHYEAIEDPVDQSRYWNAEEHPDLGDINLPKEYPYLYEDKISGLFPYDGYESPTQTKDNHMVAQISSWRGIPGSVYLYDSTTKGLYVHQYF